MARRELPHKAALRRCYTRFIEDLVPAPILDHFITHDFLPFTTIRDIKDTLSTTEKNRLIMEKVMTKDESGYRIFLKCLKDTHQPYLASQLEEQYRKLVEEAKRAAGQTNQRLGAPNYRVESPKPVNKNNADKNQDQDPTSSLVRVGFPDTSRSGSSPQSHSGNQPGPNNLMSGMGGNDMFPPPVLVSGQQQSNIDSRDSAEHLVNLPHESATPSPSTKHTSGPQLDTGSESRQHGANLTQEPTATSPSNERTAGSQLDAGSGSQHGYDHQDAGTTAVETDSSIHDTRGSRPISHPVQDNKDQNTGHRLAMVDTQASGQGQLTGHAVTEARTNILLTSTGQSPGSGESSGATRQQIDVGNRRRTVSGIHPSGSGSPEQVLDNPVVPSTSNNDAVNSKPVRCATLAGTEKRVVIKVPHDGRILDITEKFVKQFIPKEGEKKGKFGYIVGKGAYGTVYGSNDKQPDMDMHIVIKKISCHVDETKRRSATNEILAARLMHFAIVPLLGMCEDKDHTMYFLFPFLEKGDLFTALGIDRSNIENMLEVCLKRDIRLKIIYQIASAMEFIHTKVEAFRGAYVHGDIKSKNIVLDGKYNARLTDFGLARELKDNGSLTMTSSGNYGTEGYFVTGLKQDLTIRRDCCSFGVVLLELLTSFQPVDNTGELKKKKNLLTYKKSQIEAVWKDTSMYRGIHEIAQSCLDINIEYTAGCILEKFKELTRNKFYDDDKFHEEELTNPAKCQVCMLNPAMARDYQGNHDYCIKLRVCVACLRNSYFNPIKCHTCGNDIQSPIGNGWGAILVAGNDEDSEDTAKLFEEDMKLMYTTISSKCPHLMGISEKFIKRVSPSKPGTEESLREQFEAAFEALRSLDEIHTLLFFFSGHHSVTRGFRLGSRMDSVTKEEVTDELIQCKHVKKRIIFLDCCDAPVFDSKKFPKDTTLQLNACDESSGEKSHLRGDCSCSPFVLFLVQGIWHGAWPKACFLSTIPNPGHCGEICKVYKESPTTDHLISFANLKDYVGKHMTYMSKQQTPVHHVDAKRFTQDKVAYHIDKCSELKFYFRDDLHECDTKRREVVYTCKSLPDSVQELIKDLMQEFLQKDPSARSLSKYSDVICVVMTTGPKLEHYREFDTIPKLVAAWNGKRRLHYGFRKLENLQLGRVGIFLETEKKESARIIHYFLERVGITVKEPQVQGHQHDVVKIERKEVKNVFDALQKVDAEEKRASQERLQVILEALDQQEEDGGWLYFTFPYETGTTRPNERFLVVEYRTPKSNSQA